MMDKGMLQANGIATHSTRALLMHRAKDRGQHVEFLVGIRKALPYISITTASSGVPLFVPRPSASGADKVTPGNKEAAAYANVCYWGKHAIGLFSKDDLKKTGSPVAKGIKKALATGTCKLPHENLMNIQPDHVVTGLKVLFEEHTAITPVMTPSLVPYMLEKMTRCMARLYNAREEENKKRPFVKSLQVFSMGSVGLGGANGQNVGFPKALFDYAGPGSFGVLLYSKHPGEKPHKVKHNRLIWKLALSPEPFVPNELIEKWGARLGDAITHAYLANGAKPFNPGVDEKFLLALDALVHTIVEDMRHLAKKVHQSVPCDKIRNALMCQLVCGATLDDTPSTVSMAEFLAHAALTGLKPKHRYQVSAFDTLTIILSRQLEEKLA